MGLAHTALAGLRRHPGRRAGIEAQTLQGWAIAGNFTGKAPAYNAQGLDVHLPLPVRPGSVSALAVAVTSTTYPNMDHKNKKQRGVQKIIMLPAFHPQRTRQSHR